MCVNPKKIIKIAENVDKFMAYLEAKDKFSIQQRVNIFSASCPNSPRKKIGPIKTIGPISVPAYVPISIASTKSSRGFS